MNPLAQCLIKPLSDALKSEKKSDYVSEWAGPYNEHNPLYASEGILIETQSDGITEHFSLDNLQFKTYFHIFGSEAFVRFTIELTKNILKNHQYKLPLRYQNSRFFASGGIDYNSPNEATLWAKMPFAWHLDESKNIYKEINVTVKIAHEKTKYEK